MGETLKREKSSKKSHCSISAQFKLGGFFFSLSLSVSCPPVCYSPAAERTSVLMRAVLYVGIHGLTCVDHSIPARSEFRLVDNIIL